MKVVALGVWLASSLGCSEPDCTDRCGEAQDEGCPWVEGDCVLFCETLEPLATKAECTAELDGYEQCLIDTEACSIATSCAATEAAYVDCVGAYCASAPTEPECMTLENAL
ncbi:MAG: hypothetical protein JRI23_08415 [Deltaproteobacteria bacterium]|jgi:hypothetical protein|nr:hypothetical protein [Deltaproteobacteria bacterium]MBW2531637.1 hypothetical protein [Deltaproteobacteria bacterium]